MSSPPQARATEPPIGRAPKKRARGAVFWLLLGALLVGMGTLLGANLFLLLGFSKIFESTNQINVTFRRAWTIWPGTIHVRDLRLTFQDHNLQFAIDLPKAVVDVRLSALVFRTFHATRLEGEGLRFSMRHRIQPEVAKAPWVSKLAPIAEFEDPALFESTAPEPPIAESEYDLWTIHLEDVRVGVSDIWAHFVRFSGTAEARGAFRLRPARQLWVGPATLAIDGGRLSFGDRPLAATLRGNITCTVHPFDVRIPSGREVFRHFSSKLDLKAGGLRFDPIELLLGDPSPLRVRSEPGTLRINAQLDRGRFSEQSQAELTTTAFTLESAPLLYGFAGVRVALRGRAGAGGELTGSIDTASVDLSDREITPVKLAGIAGKLTSSSRDAVASWSIRAGELALASLNAEDLSFFNAALGQESPGLSGGLEARGNARFGDDGLSANATIRLGDVEARQGSVSAGLNGELSLELVRARLAERSGHLLARFRAETTRFGAPDLELETRDLSLDARVDATNSLATGTLEGSLGRLSARTRGFSLHGATELRVNIARLDLPSLQGSGSALFRLEKVRASSKAARASALRLQLDSEFHRSERGLWDATLNSKLERLRGVWEDVAWRAEPTLRASTTGFSPSGDRGSVAINLSILDFQLQDQKDPGACPFSRVEKAELRGQFELGADGDRGQLNARVEHAEFVWDDFRASLEGQLGARLRTSRERSLAEIAFVTRSLRAHLRSGSSPVNGWEATIAELNLEGTARAGEKGSGTLNVQAKQARGRIGRTRIQSDLGGEIRFSGLDPRLGEARLEGHLALSNTGVKTGDNQVENWWARIDLNSTLLRTAENLDLSSLFRAELRDATPGLVALSAEDELPQWLATVLPLRQLEVEGMVNRRCRLTDIRFTSAEGGPLIANGRLQSRPEGATGAFLVRASDLEAVSVGIGFTPVNTEVKLLVGDDWLTERQHAMDAVVRKSLENPCLPVKTLCDPSPVASGLPRTPHSNEPAAEQDPAVAER